MAKHHLFVVTHWLLKAATVLSILAAAFLILALGVVTLALGVLLVAPALLDVHRFGIPATLEGIAVIRLMAAIIFAISGGLIYAALLVLVFRAATGIVESAISGDPFVSDNAARLTRIGWLLLAISAVQFVMGTLAALAVPERFHGKFDAGSDISPVGLLAVLMIFVLAQIFRHGSEMRAELEGTV